MTLEDPVTKVTTSTSRAQKLHRELQKPVDGASLAAYRIMFGLLMIGYCFHMISTPYLHDSYAQPKMLFSYYGFGWVQRLPLPVLYGIACTMLGATVCFTVGILQRTAAAFVCLAWTYFFLLEKAYYINHFYLVSLLMFLFALLPVNGSFTPRWAGYGDAKIPGWALWSIRVQFGIVYFYAGLAKIQPDWFAGEPLRAFLRPYFDSSPAVLETTAYTFSWFGLAFDLLVVPALLWRRTRIAAILFAAGFHLSNREIFNIDFFPWLAMAGTLLFLEPDWPRRALRHIGIQTMRHENETSDRIVPTHDSVVYAVLILYFIVQFVVPFQRVLYPGNAHWTEEGQRYSWLLMMKNKTGSVEFTVFDLDSGERTVINEKHYLNDRQILMMTGDPDMLVQFAHNLADEAKERGAARVAVFAETDVSLNGRPEQPIVPPDFDLASAQRTWRHYDWIVPLEPRQKR